MMHERRRFVTRGYSATLGGYPVFDRSELIAVFVEQGLAVDFCKMLRLFPGIVNNYRNLTKEEKEEVE